MVQLRNKEPKNIHTKKGSVGNKSAFRTDDINFLQYFALNSSTLFEQAHDGYTNRYNFVTPTVTRAATRVRLHVRLHVWLHLPSLYRRYTVVIPSYLPLVPPSHLPLQ